MFFFIFVKVKVVQFGFKRFSKNDFPWRVKMGHMIMIFKHLEQPNLESVLSRMRPGATGFPECDVFVIYDKRYNSKKYDHSFKDKKF